MGETVVSSCDPTEILEAPEDELDSVAVAVEVRREAVLPTSVDLGRNIRSGSLALDLVAGGVAVTPLVTMQDFLCGHLVEQGVGCGAVRYLAAGQLECDWATEAIGLRVDFRGLSAARAAQPDDMKLACEIRCPLSYVRRGFAAWTEARLNRTRTQPGEFGRG